MADDKPIIFCDMDGCIASQGKVWHEKTSWVGVGEHGGTIKTLNVSKTISDHDSWAIDHFKKHAHIIIISGDERINRVWAERRDVPFIFTCAEGFHQNKWKHLEKYWYHNFIDMGRGLPKDNYYYLGDAMPDYKCIVNAKKAFVPYDASRFLIKELQNSNCWFKQLSVSSGNGTFEEMAHRLVHEGVLPNVV